MSPLRRRPQPAPAAQLRRRPNVGLLRRERRALLAARASRIGELGELAVEMYRFAAWRDDLLAERCAEIAGIDVRLADIERLLGVGGEALCSCGAPLEEGEPTCRSCGRPTGAGGKAADAARPRRLRRRG